jgi:hypothetical protein
MATAYWEWSSALDIDDFDPDDWDECAKVNPSWGVLLNEEFVQTTERSKLTRVELARERFGIFSTEEEQRWTVIPQAVWVAGENAESKIVGTKAFSVEVSDDRVWATIGVAGSNADGLLHLGVFEVQAGTEWVVDRIVAVMAETETCAVIVNPGGPGGSLIPALEAAGVEVVKPSTREVTQACGSIYDDVMAGKTNHLGQPLLTAAAGALRRKASGDAFQFAGLGTTDVSPFKAVALARYAFVLHGQTDASSVYEERGFTIL